MRSSGIGPHKTLRFSAFLFYLLSLHIFNLKKHGESTVGVYFDLIFANNSYFKEYEGRKSLV